MRAVGSDPLRQNWDTWRETLERGGPLEKQAVLEELAAAFRLRHSPGAIGGAVRTAAALPLQGLGDSLNYYDSTSLGRTPPESIKRDILELLKDKHGDIRARAVAALAHWRGDPSVLTAVTAALDDRDESVVFHAIRVLPVLEGEQALAKLAHFAADSNKSLFLRAYALAAMEWLAKTPPLTAAGQQRPAQAVAETRAPVRARGQPRPADDPRAGAASILQNAFPKGAGVPEGLALYLEAARRALRA